MRCQHDYPRPRFPFNPQSQSAARAPKLTNSSPPAYRMASKRYGILNGPFLHFDRPRA